MNIYASSSWRDSFENRNFKWLDNATIKWNIEERISPILSMADQWVLRKSIEEPFSPTASVRGILPRAAIPQTR